MNLRTTDRRPRILCSLAAALLAACALPALAQQSFDQAPLNDPQSQTAGYAPAQAPQPAYPPTGAPPAAQPNYPPAGTMPSGAAPPPYPPGGYGGNGGADGRANPLQGVLQMEQQDFGVPPQEQLQTQLHSPTPTRIPGGQTITTDRLLGLYQQAAQNGLLVFDVLGSGQTLPNAQNAAPASQPGSFDDTTQQEFGRYLQQVTQGNKGRPMVFYCLNTHCWMSYNAALRAIHLGFTQVYWYRGGIEAWQRAQQMSAGTNAGGQLPYPDTRNPNAYR